MYTYISLLMSPNIPSDNRALAVLNLANNNIKAKPSHALSYATGLSGHYCDECGRSCTEAYRCEERGYDCCVACNDTECPIIMLANAIKDMGAILSVNLLKNKIGVDQAKALASILKEHSTLKSLCGNRGDETELDMSGKMHGAEDAIMLVPEIIGNGALLSLNISNNEIGGYYTLHWLWLSSQVHP
jgi:hypothetical protein